MALLDLFIASSIPTVKVLLVTALGLFLALERIDILGEDTRKHMNNIVFFVFNPALVGSNLAETITYESMLELWFMPLNILITFIIGSALGWVVIQITRAPPHLRGLVLGCCAAGNLGNIFLIIIPAVCKEKGSPFGAPDVCHQYGMAYASLSMAVGAVYLWSYVYNLVRISSRASTKEVKIIDSSDIKSSRETSISQPQSYEEPLLSSKDSASSEYHANQFALPSTRFEEKAQVTILAKVKQQFGMLSRNMNLKKLFAPSTTGAEITQVEVDLQSPLYMSVVNQSIKRLSDHIEANFNAFKQLEIVGFVVGLVPQIRMLMIGDEAPLRVIQDSVSLVGDAAIPALTLIMGGNLLKGLQGSGIKKSVIVGVIVARYIALPLIGIVVVKGALRFGLVHDNPLYQFVLLLQFAVPPAMNIGTITQLFGAGESECSVIMLWTYALASIALTLWSTLFMWLVS